MTEIADPVAEIAVRARTVRFLHVGRILHGDTWRMDRHAHPRCYELLLFYSGRHSARIGEETICSGTGGAVLYPPQCVHAERVLTSDTEWTFVSFEWASAPAGLPLRMSDPSGRTRTLGDWLIEEDRQMRPGRQAVKDAILAQMLIQMLAPPVALDPIVQRVREHMRAHLAEPLNLDGLARHARLSKFHFLRTYRKLAGRTPMDDLRALRLARARELVMTTSLPLKAIAPRCGLGDGHALSRLFRRHFGRSPIAFRAVTRGTE